MIKCNIIRSYQVLNSCVHNIYMYDNNLKLHENKRLIIEISNFQYVSFRVFYEKKII